MNGIYIEGVLRKNEQGRWCIIDSGIREDLFEITSGTVFEVYSDIIWNSTRMKYDGHKNDYISTDGFENKNKLALG